MPDSSYWIECYRKTRYFALYDKERLIAVTTYRKGANAMKERLEAQDRKIAELQARFNELALASVTSLPFNTLPASSLNDSPTVHEELAPFCCHL